MNVPELHVRKYWFGIEDTSAIADTVLLMERDRLDQYRGAFDDVTAVFHGVFSGFTGHRSGKKLSVVYSIGPAHIADCVTYLAYGFNVQFFLSTGSVGGLGVGMGDLIISNSCRTMDGYSINCFPEEVIFDKLLGGYVVSHSVKSELAVSDLVSRQIECAYGCSIHYGTIFTLPAVSMEDDIFLTAIESSGHVAVDLETGPFIAACRRSGTQGACIHWVTDLPLERDFYFQFRDDFEVIHRDKEIKHRQWMNMPRVILPIVDALIEKYHQVS